MILACGANSSIFPVTLSSNLAFYIAKTGRPGPVLVDIPKDITQKLSDVKIPTLEEVKESLPGYKGAGHNSHRRRPASDVVRHVL